MNTGSSDHVHTLSFALRETTVVNAAIQVKPFQECFNILLLTLPGFIFVRTSPGVLCCFGPRCWP